MIQIFSWYRLWIMILVLFNYLAGLIIWLMRVFIDLGSFSMDNLINYTVDIYDF